MNRNDLARWTRPVLRVGLTTLALFCLLLRLTRMAESWGSVKRYYGFGLSQDLAWLLLELVFLTGPFLTGLAAILSLWLKGSAAPRLALASVCAGIFFTLEEGLVCFARAVNGNGGYVGAEPLLSLTVCAAAGVALLLSHGRRT